MIFSKEIRQFEGQPLTRQILLHVLKSYKRPINKVNLLVKQDLLTRVKKGIFVPGNAINLRHPHPFLLANHIAGPSYVSFESALRYWGLIPELVYETSSATMVNSKLYITAPGRFSYTSLKYPYYCFGQQRIELATNQFALVASPEKAICDKIVTTRGLLLRSVVQTTAWLVEDMRMDEEILATLNTALINEWLPDSPKKESLHHLIKALDSLK